MPPATATWSIARRADPDTFWREEAARIDWIRPFTRSDEDQLRRSRFRHPLVRRRHAQPRRQLPRPPSGEPRRYHRDHLGARRSRDEAARRITYRELHRDVCRFANVLKAEGVAKGDRVTIYLPMVPEAAVAMLACARIGAIHSVVFGGFSPEALAGRIEDCDRRWSSPPTKGCAAARQCRSRPMSMRRCERCPGGPARDRARRTGADVAMVDGPRHLVARRRRGA